jgi:pimeloyl-[acyl-carrier protein] methyl ester esterase
MTDAAACSSKPMLACLPGWGLRPTVWSGLAARLEPHFTVDCLALPPGRNCAERADALAARLPPRTLVCGWSLGAMVALALAERHPSRVSGLVLIGATPRFVASDDWEHGLAADVLAQFRDDFARDAMRTARRFVALQAMGDAARRSVADALAAAQCEADAVADDPAHDLADGLAILAREDLRDRCTGLGVPALVVHGARDALMPAAAARWLAEALPATLHLVPNAGHAPFLSRPDAVAALIAAHFAQVPP